MAAHFAANPGSYKATIYYRDAETSPMTWPVGTVEFRFAPVAVKKSTSSKNALPTESERLKDFQPLPEIHHIMQRKEKTPPPTVVSFAFSLIVLLPWLFLVPAVCQTWMLWDRVLNLYHLLNHTVVASRRQCIELSTPVVGRVWCGQLPWMPGDVCSGALRVLDELEHVRGCRVLHAHRHGACNHRKERHR